jgi:probable phosphoglycerate mutase
MVWLIRHGETAWSLSGAHTGLTDIPLTPAGAERAKTIGQRLYGQRFGLVLVSPLERARQTCEIVGLSDQAIIDPDLLEWDYGDYEGRTTNEIRKERPGWSLFRDGVPNGETIEQVANRARRVIARCLDAHGATALFAHGHILRILAACWLDLAPAEARHFALTTASISTLAFERENRVISRWNS